MPRKRARSSPGSSSSSDAAPLVLLDGGEPAFAPKLVDKWKSGKGFTDTTVLVDGQSFAAHKVVLASGSTYFEGLFQSETSDANAPALADTPASAFSPLLNFLYEGTCTVDQGLLVPLLRAANYLGVKPLELSIGTALQARLLPSNALALWTLAEEAVLPLLEEAAKSLALTKFEELKESLAEEASWDQVHALVSSDQLAARSEEAVFEAVVRYAEAQRPEEEQLLALMRHVRFPLMGREFLEQTVCPWPLLDTKAGKSLIIGALVPAATGSGATTCVPRAGFSPRLVYVIGGSPNTNATTSVEIFDSLTNSWTAGVALPAARKHAAAAVLEGKIYVVGGSRSSSKVEVFDPQAGAWAEIAPMQDGRSKLAAVVVDGRLFAIGGKCSEFPAMCNVEVFHPQTGVWLTAQPMPSVRVGVGAAVLDGKIYVVGGANGSGNALATVQLYDPATDSWSQAPPMRLARRNLGVAVLGGKLYAVGGFGGSDSVLNSAEVFDPQTNAWTPLPPMSMKRSHIAIAAVQGKLYVTGGWNGAAALLTAEAFDPEQKRWEGVAPMPTARYSSASSAI